ncbi:MAG: hypothetical protein Q9187_008721, partial [Circinaria calcarea]
PSCSNSHIPGYISSAHLSSAGRVFVVAVNDPFVMKAWRESLDSASESNTLPPKIRFLADPSAAFTSALDLTFDGAAIFGGDRSKRYALKTEDGVVRAMFVEPDKTGVD